MIDDAIQKYIRFNNNKNKLKILVNYIKPSKLLKSEILVPIHLGREIAKEVSKDGVISEEDLKWLLNNCIGDNDFAGNISSYNRRIGLLTGTWWAWKNYDKLGNPDYFGSFGYRRILNSDFLDNLYDYDVILPHKINLSLMTIEEQFKEYHGEKLVQCFYKTFEKVYHYELKSLKYYMHLNEGYFDELYVMKKELFFDFCKWIFPLLFEYLKEPPIIFKSGEKRDIGFIIERLSGYYFYKLSLNKAIRICEEKVLYTGNIKMDKAKINQSLFHRLRNNL